MHTGATGREFPGGPPGGLGAHKMAVLARGPVRAGHGPGGGEGAGRVPAHLSTLTHPDTVSRVPQTQAWHSPKAGSGGPARGGPARSLRGIPSVESCRCEDRRLSEKKRKADCPRARRHAQTLAPLQEVRSAGLKGHRLAQPGRKKAARWAAGERARGFHSRRPALLTSGRGGASWRLSPVPPRLTKARLRFLPSASCKGGPSIYQKES